MDLTKRYGDLGVNTQKALEILKTIHLSIHCWQGDDVGGFEQPNSSLSGGGILATGNYPGKARTVYELRDDLEKAYSLIPGTHRLNLHASYGEFGKNVVDRNAIEPIHFEEWAQWGKDNGIPFDFNATCFSHPRANDGFTLSSPVSETRKFWIEHVNHSRTIAAFFGRSQSTPCVHNLWIPDGFKDKPANLAGHRTLLTESLDEIFSDELPSSRIRDAVESKLFGIGSEAAVVGSHEFYLCYALTRGKMICLDMGHFHPTESVANKLSAVLPFQNELLLHISRPVRWDSDHVPILNEELYDMALELVRSNGLEKTHIGLDFFDASINRIGAWVLGARSTLKAMLFALLEPIDLLRELEESGKYFERLALMEEVKTMPWGEVWNAWCESQAVPTDREMAEEVNKYERTTLSKRD